MKRWIAVFLGLLALTGVSRETLAGHSHRVATNRIHTVASCTNTTGAALASNGGRVSALLVNDGTSVIWIKVGADAVANEGIRLNANGGSYYISAINDNLDRAAVNCITASATVVLLVTEWSN